MFEPVTAMAIVSAVLSVGGFPPDYQLYVLENMGQPVTTGIGINDTGQIVGMGFDPS